MIYKEIKDVKNSEEFVCEINMKDVIDNLKQGIYDE